MIIAIIVSSIFTLKLPTNALICQYLYLIIANCHDKVIMMILYDYCMPLTIIAYSKNYSISIIIKENITVNRQNWLIAHA